MKLIKFFSIVATLSVAIGSAANAATPGAATKSAEPEYVDAVTQWRDESEQRLRRDNGWLTLAGRFIMKPGANTFGSAATNDIVFPPELKGTGPDVVGTITVDSAKRSVTLKLVEGVSMTSEGKVFTGERALKFDPAKRDWVSLGRISMHVIERDGRYVLRLADNESLVRKNFPGRVWYEVNPAFKVNARFIPYAPGKKLSIVNVIDEVSEEPCPGYVEFTLKGKKYKMDVVGEDEGLFFVMRDGTSGDTTYRPSRFLFVDKKPKANELFQLDFNKTYNPPCAFSEFTTCPLPPEQNILKTRIEAGEKYRKLG
jgi:uncharacterized protein (DUF1684 family)